MIIANRLKDTNRAEYLLYMWQVENIIRLYKCDKERIEHEYLAGFDVDDDVREQMKEWYGYLCDMMRQEGCQENGHLQINKNVITGLADLNEQLLASEKFPYYKQMYYRVLPYVVELRAKSQHHAGRTDTTPESDMDEFTLLFEFLYAVMMLRLQKRDISPETQSAAKDVSDLLAQLSEYWNADKAGKLKFE